MGCVKCMFLSLVFSVEFLSLCPTSLVSLSADFDISGAYVSELWELRRWIPVWIGHRAPTSETEQIAATTTAVNTLETMVPSMRYVLSESGSSPLALWWSCGAWYLLTCRRTAAAVQAHPGTLAPGKTKRRRWRLYWWALGWPCCCCPCVSEWETNSGSSRGSKTPRTAEERQRMDRTKEKRESEKCDNKVK